MINYTGTAIPPLRNDCKNIHVVLSYYGNEDQNCVYINIF